MENGRKTLLSVKNLKTYFFQDEGTVKAVDGATFEVYPSKTLGIVGLGAIGQAVAERAKGFKMPLLYWSRSRKPDVEAALGIQYRELDDLLRESDYVSINIALSDETRGLIGELVRTGRAAAPGWEKLEGQGLPVEAAELCWLAAALG